MDDYFNEILERRAFQLLVNHVFLLPKLPQNSEEEGEHTERDQTLLEMLGDAMQIFRLQAEPVHQLETAAEMISACLRIKNDGGNISLGILQQRLQGMKRGDVIALHISAQNAGLIIRHTGSVMTFECFEASPTASEVMGCTGGLLWTFPGPVFTVSLEKAQDPLFVRNLSGFLAHMDRTVFNHTLPETTKGNRGVPRETDPADPAHITGLLAGILHGIGHPDGAAHRMQKRVRDDILWNGDGAPWRRSPLWLVLRVALQTTLRHNNDICLYKAFMVFFMTGMVKHADAERLDSDTLFLMNAKLGRRVRKASTTLPDFVLNGAREVMLTVRQTLRNRWDGIRRNEISTDGWEPEELNWENDLTLSLHNSKAYLEDVLSRRLTEHAKGQFKPQEFPRLSASSDIDAFGALNNPPKSGFQLHLLLGDFEGWVENHLESWLTNIDCEAVCQKVGDAIKQYASCAQSAYKGSPENLSLMFLTILELWVALDNAARTNCDLLNKYSPEIPDTLLEPLLLPKRSQLERLHRVEKYIRDRHGDAERTAPRILSDVVNNQTFAVQFWNQSLLHQELQRRIETEATKERAQKMEEYHTNEGAYFGLKYSAQGLPCEYVTKVDSYDHPFQEHSKTCKKCLLNYQADQMSILPHRWPLPSGDMEKKVAVFELQCPSAFCTWREITYLILADLCSPKTSAKCESEPGVHLKRYANLRRHYIDRNQRLGLASPKGFSQKPLAFPVPEGERSVCVEHGMAYRMYDEQVKNWVSGSLQNWDVRPMSTLQLSSGPYQNMQYMVDDTSHTSNQVLARQHECPKDISRQEYEAFGVLRAGHHLQWLNIARELRVRNLSWGSEAVSILLMQAAWQAGPRLNTDTGERESHLEPIDPQFAKCLLSEISGMWDLISDNWREAVAAQSLLVLSARVLSLTASEKIKTRAADLMRRGREVIIRWVRQLVRAMSQGENPDDNMSDLHTRLYQVACICRISYDVDQTDLPRVLASGADVEVAVECAIILHDNSPLGYESLSPLMRSLHDRNRCLGWRLQPRLQQLIVRVEVQEALNGCIRRSWSNFESGHRWETLSEPFDQWITTRTNSSPERHVQLDILTGRLLIDGLPLKRLPAEYTQHATYARIFGKRIFDCAPGSDGMRYQSKQDIWGWQVYFSCVGEELVIRTKKDDRVRELIPHHKIAGDFPKHLIEKYTHWICPRTGQIEFRPLNDLWTESSKNPRVFFFGPVMKDERRVYIDIRSPTTAMIRRVLQPLEPMSYIEITVANESSVMEVFLPRLKLAFFVNGDKQLECRQFQNMIVDDDQSIGTCIGLKNRLVLRDNNRDKDYHARKVLIPYGDVKYSYLPHSHVTVTIDSSGDEDKLLYYVYDIDTILNRLTGTSCLASRLYKIYLHAVTSFCLPDPLTLRTGTEEALYELRSASTWSFRELCDNDVHMLRLIRALAPERCFAPHHLRCMQTVTWNELPSLSQHEEFFKAVQGLFEFSGNFALFHEAKDPQSQNLGVSNAAGELMERAAIRNAVFRTQDFGGAEASLRRDLEYTSRDNPSENFQKVSAVAQQVDRWSTSLDTFPSLFDQFKSWGEMVGCSDDGLAAAAPGLGYHNSWLVDSALHDRWCSLYAACTTAVKEHDKYNLMFMLSTLVYAPALDNGHPIDLRLVWTLLAFATVPWFREIPMPQFARYDLRRGEAPTKNILADAAEGEAIGFENSNYVLAPLKPDETVRDWRWRMRRIYDAELRRQSEALAAVLMDQWVCSEAALPADGYPLLNLRDVDKKVKDIFRNWYMNLRLKEHTTQVQAVLNDICGAVPGLPYYSFPRPRRVASAPVSSGNVSITNVSAAHITRNDPPPPQPRPRLSSGSPAESLLSTSPLRNLLSGLIDRAESDFQKCYAEDLMNSLSALAQEQRQDLAVWASLRMDCRSRLDRLFKDIVTALRTSSLDARAEEILQICGLWPSITPVSLLRLLAMPTCARLEPGWKRLLVDYGLAMTELQRAERLHALALGGEGSRGAFLKELGNVGHQDWHPTEYPDWLLLEIENNLLIRPIQAHIASRMMSPPNGRSSVLQLNMGEGKSSVIVPIISAALADTERLVRVVVLKPLSAQMFRLLVEKLGGLTNRRVYCMPFNRAMIVDSRTADHIQCLYEECMANRGILLVQPEHILSFKLMGLEKLYNDSTREVAAKLLRTQCWLETNARDVLDESDEILHARYQLIYTLGDQRPIEHSPHRWRVTQHLFDLVGKNANDLRDKYPQGVEIHNATAGRFPQVRILEAEAGAELVRRLVNDIYEGRLPGISFRLWGKDDKHFARRFIEDPRLTEDHRGREFFSKLRDVTSDQAPLRTLLLLRGLIAHSILLVTLRDKRWRVDYGLDEDRVPPTLLAVPYRAKDCPALRAEFSHPDVAITLTCLSYYYGGLTDSQLEVSFVALLKCSNPATEYEKWVEGSPDIPESMRTLAGVNIDDIEQRRTIFLALKYRKNVIDFYLSRMVFPRDAKEFPYKLTTSGWDLAERRKLPTTGFSGTNDNRFLLPLSMEQNDLTENASTNARVLSYLLKPENDHYEPIVVEHGQDKVEVLLNVIVNKHPKVRVVLDVGAQILWKNELVAARLLELGSQRDPDLQSAVFFDDNDELIVLTRDGSTELFAFSPFAKQLDKCFVYLDESHTRGTDLKLPVDSKAAVTLGPKLSKDRLVQACMRMRQLGNGHTLVYFAPTEVHQKISRIARDSPVRSSHVVKWAIEETCASTKYSVPLWASQGFSYAKRQEAWLRYCEKSLDLDPFLEQLREPESQTLEELYGFPSEEQNNRSALEEEDSGRIRDLEGTTKKIVEKCRYFDVRSLMGVRVQEEQEREVAQEAEQERQIEPPPPAVAANHGLHKDLRELVSKGAFPDDTVAFKPAFESLRTTSASEDLASSWNKNLLVTADFARTIQKSTFSVEDDFLRSVNWVLSLTGERAPPCMIICSPYEINKLLPEIRTSKHVRLHVYAPRVTKEMRTLELMDFCAIPPGPALETTTPIVRELNIFAGQLYLRDFAEYKNVCGLLGLHLGDVGEKDHGHVYEGSAGFMSWERRQELGISGSPFRTNPVDFVRYLLVLRGKGFDYLGTQMGRLLRGELLFEDRDFV